MSLNITKKNEQPLLKRTEIHAEITYERMTPSRDAIIKEIAKKTGASEDTVVLKHIDVIQGSRKANILAYAYEDAAAQKFLKPREGKKAAAELKPAEQGKA